MFWVKEHKGVLAVCDEEMLGKKFEKGKRCLEASENFYKGKLVSRKKLKELLAGYDNINIIGKKSIGAAEEMKIAACKDEVCGVPYTIIFKL